MSEAARKTPEEITALKLSWLADPCWDIEDTDGFEAHRAELTQYRLETEADWEKKRISRLKEKAEKWGIPGNIKLAAYLESLEQRVVALEEAAKN
jgi:hypothetical protein